MAKTDATRRRKRQSKVVTNEVGEEERNVNNEGHTETVCSSEQITGTEEAAATESTEMKQEEKDRDEQDSQMEAVIVKGSAPTVNVSWEERNEEGEGDDSEKRTNPSDQMTAKEVMGNGNGKRKAQANIEASPPKKTKLISDGYCVYVGNLNNTKTFEEVKNSLASYFMTQSLLFQDIRLNRSKKHAHIELASEMDLTKALTLNGEMILDKPVKIAQAKVRSEDKVKVKVKVKVSPEDKKAARDARCLFLKNVPYNATKKDILKIFHKAIAVRFPGETEGPSQGIAFVEFKNKKLAKKVMQKRQGAKIQGRALIVDSVGGAKMPKVTKASDKDTNKKVAPPPNNTLFVSNLSINVKEKQLRNIFQKAVGIKMPQRQGKSKGYAFVEFASVADAEQALQASHNIKISKRTLRVQFFEMRAQTENAKVLPNTLIVMGLAENTTAETLKSAFEGALSARVAVDKGTGASKGFGFVEFENEEICKAVKDAMTDCEIDGSKVTVAYAKSKSGKGHQGASGGSAGRPGDQPAGRGAGKGGQGGRGGVRRRGGKGRTAGKPQDAAKEVENKG